MQFTNEELDKILEHIEQSVDDIDEYIGKCYSSLVFLGSSVVADDEVQEAALLNIVLCERFFFHKEDYEKLQILTDLRKTLNNKPKIAIDHEIIDDIRIIPN